MSNYTIDEVLPHEAPMILINELVDYNSESAMCSVTIKTHSPFYNEHVGGVPSYIGVEYMAQAIAAHSGALAKDTNKAVEIGFLIGTRKYKTHQGVFYNNSVLTVCVEKLYHEESGLSVFECQIHERGKIVCEAKINVFQPSNPLQFIRENQ